VGKGFQEREGRKEVTRQKKRKKKRVFARARIAKKKEEEGRRDVRDQKKKPLEEKREDKSYGVGKKPVIFLFKLREGKERRALSPKRRRSSKMHPLKKLPLRRRG